MAKAKFERSKAHCNIGTLQKTDTTHTQTVRVTLTTLRT